MPLWDSLRSSGVFWVMSSVVGVVGVACLPFFLPIFFHPFFGGGVKGGG